jgi:DNA polymerase-3 subunit beta
VKFTCKQSDLAKALTIVSRAVTSRTTIPILKGILLQTEGIDRLSLSASDLDISIETRIDVAVTEEGSVVLPSKLFGAIVRRMPQGDVMFSEEENGSVDIKCMKTEFKVVGISSDEFPKIHGEMTGERIYLDKSKLKEMIRKTCFAAGVDETRGIITGVLMKLKKDSIHMVALDGFRMAVVREEAENEEEKDIIIPAGIMKELGRIISDTDDEDKSAANEGEEKKEDEKDRFSILTDEKKILFDLKNTIVVSRLLEGVFVKYEDIIPKENKTFVIVNRSELQESAERASVLIREGKNNFIRMEISDGSIKISSRNEEGAFRDEVSAEIDGEPLEIGFNARFILDVLKVLTDEDIKLEFNTSVTPCLIRPTEGNSYEYLVLPIRLASSV